MEQEQSADLILNKIKKRENAYLINGDQRLTEETAKKIREINWMELETVNDAKRTDMETLDIYGSSMELECIRAMRENAGITGMNKPGSKFYLIKKVINRILMMTNRYQENFNLSTIRTADMMAERISKLEQNQNILYNQCMELMRQLEQDKEGSLE